MTKDWKGCGMVPHKDALTAKIAGEVARDHAPATGDVEVAGTVDMPHHRTEDGCRGFVRLWPRCGLWVGECAACGCKQGVSQGGAEDVHGQLWDLGEKYAVRRGSGE